MVDTLTPAQRSANMRKIRGRNTKPELAVRRVLRSLGVGYRLHSSDLPGRPDVVLRSRCAVIFVHGCFWHRHSGCRCAYTPKSRQDFWLPKFEKNVARDAANLALLSDRGWKTLVVWECETRDDDALREKLARFIDSLSSTNRRLSAVRRSDPAFGTAV